MKDNEEHYFGEWVEYRNEEEKIEARQYLELWKKFFMRKVPDMEFVEEQIVDRVNIHPINITGTYFGEPKSTLALKICMKGKKPKNVLNLSDLPIN